MALVTFIAVPFLLPILCTANVKLIEQPKDTVAEVGDTIILNCVVQPGPKVSVYWKMVGDAEVYLTDNTRVYENSAATVNSIHERIEIVGDTSRGVYNLKIKDILGTDSGRFLCLYFVDRIHEISSRVAALTVLAPPFAEYPICSLTPRSHLKIGVFVRMTCVTSGGIPPARIYWKRFEEMLPAYRHEQDGRTYISYEFTLSDLDNGAVFTCDAVSPAIKTPRFCSVRPYINETTVRVQPRDTLIHGQDGVFDCVASAIPPANVFEWRINNVPVYPGDNRYQLENKNITLRISPLEISDKGTEISCIAGNTHVVVTGNASMVMSVTKLAAVNGPEIIGIIVGIVVGIVLAFIILTALLKYKRKRDFFKDLDFDKACRNSYVFSRHIFSRKSTQEEPHPPPNNNTRPDSRVIMCSTPQEAINIHSNELHRLSQMQSGNPRYSVGFYTSSGPVNTSDDTGRHSKMMSRHLSSTSTSPTLEEEEEQPPSFDDAIYANIDEVQEEQCQKPLSSPPKPPPQALKPRISGPVLNYSTNNSEDIANAISVGILDRSW